jgi:hypothetical protein
MIVNAIRQRFNGLCDVLHIHNPTLAKNKKFLDIIKSLQKRGLTLFLQIHDFAEDGRPHHYFADEYPVDCHYGVINQRDYDILLTAGLNEDGLHRLANSADPGHISPRPELEKSLVLYPVRAIRRKNIGEAILLSLYFRPEQTLAVTLPPNSLVDKNSYTGWKTFVKERDINFEFEIGLKHDFYTLVLSAQFLITTSITEGFGFSFLEPWLFKKLLWGRSLPDICRDFTDQGIQLDHLYAGLHVPVDWIGWQGFIQRWTASVKNACRLFNLPTYQILAPETFESITKDDLIDFGILDEAAQKEVIIRLITSKFDAEKLIRINPFLSDPGRVSNRSERIKANRQIIQGCFNATVYRQKIQDLYHKVAANPVQQKIDKTVLASAFLNLQRFSLLKWGDYVE